MHDTPPEHSQLANGSERTCQVVYHALATIGDVIASRPSRPLYILIAFAVVLSPLIALLLVSSFLCASYRGRGL